MHTHSGSPCTCERCVGGQTGVCASLTWRRQRVRVRAHVLLGYVLPPAYATGCRGRRVLSASRLCVPNSMYAVVCTLCHSENGCQVGNRTQTEHTDSECVCLCVHGRTMPPQCHSIRAVECSRTHHSGSAASFVVCLWILCAIDVCLFPLHSSAAVMTSTMTSLLYAGGKCAECGGSVGW